jgi:queuosine precursor transporter
VTQPAVNVSGSTRGDHSITTGAALRHRSLFDIVVATFCAMLLISNVGATKLIEFGPFLTDGGAFLFPLTYVLGDVLSEVYGLRAAKRAILTGFVLQMIASLSFWAVQSSPPAAEWVDATGASLQPAFENVLGFVPRIVLASLAGYLAGQFLNAWVLVRMKQWTGGRRLWARLLGSTVVGEFADTLVFCLVARLGGLDFGGMVNYILVGFLWKTGVEAVMLPVTYRVITLVKRREELAAQPTAAAAP